MRHGNLNSGNNHRRRHNASFQNEWSALADIFGVAAKEPTVLDHKTFESLFKNKPKAATDAELISDYLLNNNQSSFTLLYDRYKWMKASINYIVHDYDDAKDVLHNAWEHVLMAFKEHAYHEEGHFEAWFKKICKQEAKDWNIKKVRLLHGEEHMPEKEANGLSAEQQLLNKKNNRTLHKALKLLEGKEKVIVIMRALQGKSFAEIAMDVHMQENVVRAVYSRIRKKFRGLVE